MIAAFKKKKSMHSRKVHVLGLLLFFSKKENLSQKLPDDFPSYFIGQKKNTGLLTCEGSWQSFSPSVVVVKGKGVGCVLKLPANRCAILPHSDVWMSQGIVVNAGWVLSIEPDPEPALVVILENLFSSLCTWFNLTTVIFNYVQYANPELSIFSIGYWLLSFIVMHYFPVYTLPMPTLMCCSGAFTSCICERKAE